MMMDRWLSGVIFASLLSFILSPLASAEDAKPSDVRILVDISGSMKETDPANLRIPAVNLLVELLPDNAQGGVWTFGQFVNMLVPLAPVDSKWRALAKKEATSINSVGLFTNLTGALEKASWKLAADSGFNQSLILLTDGKIDMPAVAGKDVNASERIRLFKSVLPAYAAAGAKIHTVALSDQADKKLLQQIALETGGMYLEASDSDGLLKAFLKAFDRAVPAEQVPMTDNKFTIDDSVKEFTALIFRRPGAKETRLISPSGKAIASGMADDKVRWHQDVNFDLITVSEPEAGEWQADADLDPDNRVQILSDLSLSVTGLPNSLFSGNPIELEMALKNSGDTVAEKAILSLTDFTLKVTAPDGRSGSKLLSDPENLPEDGVFKESLTRLSQIGEYQFEVTAVGRTFQRRQLLTASLMEPLAVTVTDFPQEERVHIRVSAESDNVDTGLSRVIAKITSPDASSLINTMTFDPAANAWQMDLTPDKGPGHYEVVLNIRGVTSSGATFRSKPDDVIRDFPLLGAGHDTAASEPVSSEEKAAEPQGGQPDKIDEAQVSEPSGPEANQPRVEEPKAEPDEPPAEPAEPPRAEIAPDLAKRFAEQAGEEPVVEEVADDGLPWWVYVLLAVGNLALFGGAGAWWFLKKRKAKPADMPAPVSSGAPGLASVGEALTDEDFSGDFDSFSDAAEEDIPMPEERPVQSPSSMGSDTNINVSLDDDFAIDPDPEDATGPDDDWGEFDTDDKK
ncbi:VWA domain-containing protein [Thalassolituus sp. LLYu03]|uniref:VWA domain-containing protein n=1 Tax=Thalassolituus sp. LLYu03 TaxID=3421656 RepID=UPI003D2DFF16